MFEEAYEDLLQEQASRLSHLRIERGNPSLRTIEERALKLFAQEKASLPIATQSAAFSGRYVGLDKLMWLVRCLMSWDVYGDDCSPPGHRDPSLDEWRIRWRQITTARPQRRKPATAPTSDVPGYTSLHLDTGPPVHLIWLLDCSRWMYGDRAAQLNFAIREAIPALRAAAHDNFMTGLKVRAVAFGAGARWMIREPTHIDRLEWPDVTVDGSEYCEMGAAFRLVAGALKIPQIPRRSPKPVLALVSSTTPTDDWRSGLRELDDTPWGTESVRVAIPVGAGADRSVLQEFLKNPELQPLDANRPKQLAAAIRWAETEVEEDVW
ncbi:hypothetical protein OG249_36700 [Streptomyces microflavus]|uniref:vWA domain-containing protein n=1 Tax=Streptomyces microflavus TaxID=1919 RepID=UPI0022505C86|nr:hypothetical protein [Streptomyces microflavus]MCX4657402.1 hypothetical protein [Streptomyces microflavus]